MIFLIAGDFFVDPLLSYDIQITKDVENLFRSSNFNIINLESPITKPVSGNEIIKTGPHLSGNSKAFKILKQLNVNLVTLANNHIMDYGKIGLEDTIIACKQNSINFVGAGMNLQEAQQPYYIENDGIRIAFLNFAENEWASADINKAGANPLDIIDNFRIIQETRCQADYVILIIHGGREHYHLPSPRMTKQYRFYAENGADMIVGHHPHWIGGYEIHNNVPIIYSLGNMIFTSNSSQKEWYKGLILQIEIENGKQIKWQMIPIKQQELDFRLSLLVDLEKENVLNEVESYAKIIADKDKLHYYWSKYIEKWENHSLNVFSPISAIPNQYLRGALRRFGLNKILLQQKNLTKILNLIRCESHYDLIKEVLESRIYKDS